MNREVLRINKIQKDILVSISELILLRELEESNHKKISINAFSISKNCGRSYNTVKKYLKELNNLKD